MPGDLAARSLSQTDAAEQAWSLGDVRICPDGSAQELLVFKTGANHDNQVKPAVSIEC